MNRNEKFGQRLRELRKEKEIAESRKWTCDQVGKAIGITPSGYTNYENSLRIPKLDGSYKVYPNNTTHYESYTFTKEEFSKFEVLGTIFKIIRTPRFDDL